MDNATTNTKRKLAEEHPDQPDATLLKGTPWFEDGTIIIHAQSTRFKVYRGMLAEKSAIFADMLSLPRPASSSTTEDDDFDDGCPVVRLSDTAEDWGCMLDNLFNRRHEFTPLSFPVTLSLLRLGHKYQFADILGEILE
ncbi:hypothetical protein HWV62_40866 [Athelia sp. TMB]|nr:hypothetical protein HWV62_40866 [Athelia sp. TMB]